jgi:restriction system protein
MNPRQFEEFVCDQYRRQGYKVELTSYTNDYGVDAFAVKGKQKIAVQAKMYGSSTRKINRQMVMELHGAKDFFDCTKAVIATDGEILPDALQVANKLKIEVLILNATAPIKPKQPKKQAGSFNDIWERFIIPLQGKTLVRSNGDTNKIIKADWSGIQRITSNGKSGTIKIEIFKYAVNKLLKDKFITRDDINQNYAGRASSGIILILSQVPFFCLTASPIGLKMKANS